VSTVVLDLSGLGIFPTCITQERVLLNRAMSRQPSGGPPPSLVRFGMVLVGRVDAQVVRDTLRRLVARHAALRFSFAESRAVSLDERRRRIVSFQRTGILEPGIFTQTVHQNAEPLLTIVDWREAPKLKRDNALVQFLQEEDQHHFEDSGTSRLRATLIHEDADRAMLIVSVDHVVFDAASAAIARRELRALLARPTGHPASPSTAETDFASFAEWQRRAMSTPYFRSSLAFWRDQWSKFARYRITLEDLPFSLPPPQTPNYTFATEEIRVDEAEATAVRQYAVTAKTTVFTVCLAAFAAVLSEYAGRSSVVIWSHLLNRVQPGTANSVGFFINTHILGIDVPPACTGNELVRQVSGVVRSALAHQELPLPYLWTQLRCAPRVGDPQVLLDFRAIDTTPMDAETNGLRTERLPLPDATTPRFSALGVTLIDDGHALLVAATYSSALFPTAGVRDLLQNLSVKLLHIANDPGAACRRSSGADRAPQPKMDEFILLDGSCIPLSE
jgi:hypothetical protein